MEGDGERMKGTVKWFSDTKGWGLIASSNGGGDFVVEQSSIRTEGVRILSVGEDVEFLISTDDEGRTRAVDVTGPGEGPVQRRNPGGGEGSAAGGDYDCGSGGGDNVGGSAGGVNVTVPGEGPVQGSNPGGGGGSGDGGYGGGSRGCWYISCFTCSGSEHSTIDGPRACTTCGRLGHETSDCPRAPLCPTCGQRWHNEMRCPFKRVRWLG